MNALKTLLKWIFKLMFFVLLALAGYIIYVQATKPNIPDFDQMKSDFNIAQKSKHTQWVTLDELPQALSNYYVERIKDARPRNYLFDRIDASLWGIPHDLILRPKFDPKKYHYFWEFRRAHDPQQNSYSNLVTCALLQKSYPHNITPDFESSCFSENYLYASYFLNMMVDIKHHWSDEEISEAYINLLPYSYNIIPYSLHHLSRVHFDKTPNQLDLYEAIVLMKLTEMPLYRTQNKPDFPERLLRYSCDRLTQLSIPEYEKNCERLSFVLDLAPRHHDIFLPRKKNL